MTTPADGLPTGGQGVELRELTMPEYYAEVYLPNGTNAEDSHRCSTFDEAFDWLERRLEEDPQRVGRFKTDESLTVEQASWVQHRKIDQVF